MSKQQHEMNTAPVAGTEELRQPDGGISDASVLIDASAAVIDEPMRSVRSVLPSDATDAATDAATDDATDDATDAASGDVGESAEEADGGAADGMPGTDSFDLTNNGVPVPETPLGDATPTDIRAAVDEAVKAAVPTAVSAAVLEAASAAAVASVEQAVHEAVAAAIAQMEEKMNIAVSAKAEEDLLGHIRAFGLRPHENGVHGAAGVRMHPAVDRLTRKDRAALAERAAHGEVVRL